jgi:hypothetical protein
MATVVRCGCEMKLLKDALASVLFERGSNALNRIFENQPATKMQELPKPWNKWNKLRRGIAASPLYLRKSSAFPVRLGKFVRLRRRSGGIASGLLQGRTMKRSFTENRTAHP